MDKIKFYLDESINVALSTGLKRRGVEVVTARDANNLGLTDVEQLDYAFKNDFVIVTHDDDFLSFTINKEHAGIVYVHQQKYSVGDLIRNLKLLWDIASPDQMKSHIEFL